MYCLRCNPDPILRKLKRNGWKSMDERYLATEEIDTYIRNCGYNLRVLWECEWKELDLTPPRTYYTPTEDLFRMTQRQILEGVEDGLIFGLIECDLHVPEQLKPYFEEFTPIFKNVEVTMADIGPTMQAYCNDPDPNRNCSFTGIDNNKSLVIQPLHQITLLCELYIYIYIIFRPFVNPTYPIRCTSVSNWFVFRKEDNTNHTTPTVVYGKGSDCR